MEKELLMRARDAGYTAVGFGVLAFQRMQVQRRELTREMGGAVGGRAGATVARFVREAERVVDPVLDQVERRLPMPARTYLHQARAVTRVVQHTLLPG
jgi:hypothetical protein